MIEMKRTWKKTGKPGADPQEMAEVSKSPPPRNPLTVSEGSKGLKKVLGVPSDVSLHSGIFPFSGGLQGFSLILYAQICIYFNYILCSF